MERLFTFVLKIRWLILFFVIVITAFLGWQTVYLKINSDVVSSLPDNDRDAVLLKKIGTQFGGNKTGMIILETDNIFTTVVLEHVRQITDSLTNTTGISNVTSLTTAMDIKADKDGMMIGKLVDENDLADTPGELNVLKDRVLSNNNYRGILASEDGTSTIIIFSIEEDVNMQSVAGTVKDKIVSLDLPEKIFFAGSPMLLMSIAHLISSDLIRLIPIAILLISLVLYIGFRSFRGVVLPLLTAVISIIWAIGIMSLIGSELTMVTNNIPIVLMAVSTAYAIHVINRIDQVNGNLRQAIITSLKYVTIPVILAALTTVAGFLSFIFGSYLTMIRDFGIYSALGTFIALLLSIFFVPALISVTNWKNKTRADKETESGKTFFSRYFHVPLHRLLFNRTRAVLYFWIILTLAGTGGIFFVKRNVDIRNYFGKSNPTRIAEDIMSEKFGGSKPVFVLFSGDIQSPEILNKMLEAEEYMKKSPGVKNAQSIAGLIADIKGAMGEGRQIPDDKEKIEQLWFLLEGNENIQKFVSDDLREAVIISKFMSTDNKERKDFKEYMNKFIKENSNPDCKIEVTGMPFIEVTMDRNLINSQIGSLIFAVIFVIIIVSSILRSFNSGIFAALPIISTILILFGFMGFTGIPLNMSTVLVASIAMGIGIDYSIHVITHFNSHISEGASISMALDETIAVSGKAILINLISVSAGFLVLMFSELVPLKYFGLLISLSMVGSGLSALTFLPVILIMANRGRKTVKSVTENQIKV